MAIFAVSPAAFVRVVYASPCSELLSIAMRSVERDAERVGRPPPTVSESGEWRRESMMQSTVRPSCVIVPSVWQIPSGVGASVSVGTGDTVGGDDGTGQHEPASSSAVSQPY